MSKKKVKAPLVRTKTVKPTPHLNPSLGLLVRLGSIVVHTDEMLSDSGHSFDRTVIEQLLQDAEVVKWISDMGPLLPRKRT